MSLTPKVIEVAEFAGRLDIDLLCISETWLKEHVADSVVEIPNYSIIRRDRQGVQHGSVCLYVKDTYSKLCVLKDLICCADHEILWVLLRPKRLPRGFSCIVLAIVYHPPAPATTNNGNIRDHLFNSPSLAESKYQNCALIVCGDFNRPDIQPILNHFRLKQIVKVTTRKSAILDLMLTNLYVFYDNPSSYPPFGLSDRNTVLCSPKTKKKTEKTTKFIFKRDLRPSHKAEPGRYLASID